MEELEEERETSEIKHGSKAYMDWSIEREEARKQTASLSLERRSSVAHAQPALKRERPSNVINFLPLSRSSEVPTLKREVDSELHL